MVGFHDATRLATLHNLILSSYRYLISYLPLPPRPGTLGPYLLVRVRVWPERHLAQSYAIALWPRASERASDREVDPLPHITDRVLLVVQSHRSPSAARAIARGPVWRLVTHRGGLKQTTGEAKISDAHTRKQRADMAPMVHTWYMVHGAWCMVRGTWYMVQGRQRSPRVQYTHTHTHRGRERVILQKFSQIWQQKERESAGRRLP